MDPMGLYVKTTILAYKCHINYPLPHPSGAEHQQALILIGAEDAAEVNRFWRGFYGVFPMDSFKGSQRFPPPKNIEGFPVTIGKTYVFFVGFDGYLEFMCVHEGAP